jgi:RimJ/RimL family protein N-acetyltransferase
MDLSPSGARHPRTTEPHFRPIRPDDESRLVELFRRLSPRSVYHRFLAQRPSLPAAWYHTFANVDYDRRFALVAEHETAGDVELVGVARYEPTEAPEVAEIAIVVDDAWQGQGLGRTLLEKLLDEAHARGIRRFRAVVLGDNRRMLALLAHATHIERQTLKDGVIEVEFRQRPHAA